MKMNEDKFSEFLTEYRKDGFQHASYDNIFEAIKNGEPEELERFDWDTGLRFGIGKMSDDPVTQARYLVVVASTLASQIACNEGVESELAFSLPDYYIQIAQKINSVKELTLLTKNLLIHFCIIIKKQKTVPYSHMTKRMVEYIYNNIYSPIYVNDIAKHFDMNPSYLSKYFKEKTGIHLKEYIHIEKLKEAKNLMGCTNLSFTEIALHLGYSDLSHFTKVCKIYTNKTPKQLKTQEYEGF